MHHTLETCMASASRFTRRSDWSKADQSSYAAAKKRGWFDACVAHMTSGNKQWRKDECVAVAGLYETRNDFKRGEHSMAYSSARYNGWLEECCAHMTAQTESWTLDKCKAIALQYQVQKHWRNAHQNSFAAALRNGWLDECCAHMIKREDIGFEECKASAEKFDTRVDWKRGDARTYAAAGRNRWLELCCEHMGEPNTVSSVEGQVFEYVISICPDAVRGERTLLGGKMEIDIYVPSLKVGIEFNGIEWHCDKRGKDLNAHQYKTNVAKSRGIRLVHVWSDEWENSRPVVEGYLRRLLQAPTRKVLARRCELVETTGTQQREFLEANHLQGMGNGGRGYALIHEGETVAVALFLINTSREHELVRWCVKMDVDVVGGFSKIMSRVQPRTVTFCDTTKFDGSGYEGAGWVLVGRSQPIVFYTDKHSKVRYSAETMRKPMLIEKLLSAGKTQGELDGKTQNDLAKMLGYNRVAGCELLKFEYNPL